MPKILNDARLDMAVLAEKAGVSHGYLRLIAAGKRNPKPELRERIAAALRDHGVTLADLADQLDPP